MENKEQALIYIKQLAEQKILTKGELNAAYDSGVTLKEGREFGIAEILYNVGAIIVFLGLIIFLAQNNSVLSFGVKLLASIGVGLVSYVAGLLLSKDARTEAASGAFYLISNLIMPTGLFFIFMNAGLEAGSLASQSLIALLMLVFNLLSFHFFRKDVFVLFSILFGTWLFFGVTGFMSENSPLLEEWQFNEYRFLVVGISYLLMAYYFQGGILERLRGFLYGFGIVIFLASSFALGGYSPHQNIFWETIFPLLVFGTLFLSVHIKNKAFLVWGTLFLMAYIFKISSAYFANSLGWPLALVLAGFLIIAAGFASLAIKNKYLRY